MNANALNARQNTILAGLVKGFLVFGSAIRAGYGNIWSRMDCSDAIVLRFRACFPLLGGNGLAGAALNS